uniref:Uncharacterized protein n=1 Tax=Cacopsylla melanoneura TaxID=428564 RepID=A0A8D8YJ31_9HEMI
MKKCKSQRFRPILNRRRQRFREGKTPWTCFSPSQQMVPTTTVPAVTPMIIIYPSVPIEPQRSPRLKLQPNYPKVYTRILPTARINRPLPTGTSRTSRTPHLV